MIMADILGLRRLEPMQLWPIHDFALHSYGPGCVLQAVAKTQAAFVASAMATMAYS